MDRRTFNKSVAAMLSQVAMGVTLPDRNKPEIDLQPFCDSDCIRYNLADPFYHDAHIVATDGFVMVRMPRRLNLGNGRREVPDTSHLDFSLLDCAGWRPWPRGGYVQTVGCASLCDDCDSTGKINWRKCPCQGTEPWVCGECFANDGKTGDECPRCKGNGMIALAKQMGGRNSQLVAINREQQLLTLPGLEWCPEFGERIMSKPSQYYPEPILQPIPFRFHGGHGLVMPLDGSARAA